MKSRVFAALAGLGLALSFGGAADAQIRLDRPPSGGQPQQPQPQQAGSLLSALTPELGIRLLQQAGYKGGEVLQTRSETAKAFRMDMNGQQVTVVLLGCKPEGCALYQFFLYFGKQEVSADFINGYNAASLYGRLYTDKDGDLTLNMGGHVIGGVAPAHFTQQGGAFAFALKQLIEYKPG